METKWSCLLCFVCGKHKRRQPSLIIGEKFNNNGVYCFNVIAFVYYILCVVNELREMKMKKFCNLLVLAMFSIGSVNAMENVDVDYIDSAQVRAYGAMRNVEIGESTSTSSFVFFNFNLFLDSIDTTIDEMSKERNYVTSAREEK